MSKFKNSGMQNYINILKKNIVNLIIVFFIFFVDRISKNIVIGFENQDKIFVNDFLNIDLTWNTGIAFGIFSLNAGSFYNLLTLVIFLILLVLIYLLFKSNFYEKILLSTILGGALGNFYDRVTYYAVPDFIDLHYKSFHWFTFNVADIFITTGIIMFLIKEVKYNDK